MSRRNSYQHMENGHQNGSPQHHQLNGQSIERGPSMMRSSPERGIHMPGVLPRSLQGSPMHQVGGGGGGMHGFVNPLGPSAAGMVIPPAMASMMPLGASPNHMPGMLCHL